MSPVRDQKCYNWRMIGNIEGMVEIITNNNLGTDTTVSYL